MKTGTLPQLDHLSWVLKVGSTSTLEYSISLEPSIALTLKQKGHVSKQYMVGRPSTTLSGTRTSCTPEVGSPICPFSIDGRANLPL